MSRYGSATLYIKSEDPADTAAWFEVLLEAKRISVCDLSGSTAISMELGGMSLIITGAWENELPLPASIQPRYGVDSLRLTVADLDSEIATLKAKGGVFLAEPEVMQGQRTVFLEGPERLRVQLLEDSSL